MADLLLFYEDCHGNDSLRFQVLQVHFIGLAFLVGNYIVFRFIRVA
jgi:hypothetical protein